MANLDNGVILGALGSSFSNTEDTIFPPTGMVIASIQFLSGNSKITTLIAETPSKTFNTAEAANNKDDAASELPTVDEGGGGDQLTSAIVFPEGTVIYGRWTSAVFADHTTTGKGVICYFGY